VAQVAVCSQIHTKHWTL